jgi:hypothetical protein
MDAFHRDLKLSSDLKRITCPCQPLAVSGVSHRARESPRSMRDGTDTDAMDERQIMDFFMV